MVPPSNGCMDPFLFNLECPQVKKGTDYELERGVGMTCSPYGADAAMTHTPHAMCECNKQANNNGMGKSIPPFYYSFPPSPLTHPHRPG